MPFKTFYVNNGNDLPVKCTEYFAWLGVKPLLIFDIVPHIYLCVSTFFIIIVKDFFLNVGLQHNELTIVLLITATSFSVIHVLQQSLFQTRFVQIVIQQDCIKLPLTCLRMNYTRTRNCACKLNDHLRSNNHDKFIVQTQYKATSGIIIHSTLCPRNVI